MHYQARQRSTSWIFKTLPICIKVPPIERALQDESDYINLECARPNPAAENASEIPKTRHFNTLTDNNGASAETATPHAL